VKNEQKWMGGDPKTSNSCIFMQRSDDFAGDVLLGTDDCKKQHPFVCEVENYPNFL
jgi:hypothetical protein